MTNKDTKLSAGGVLRACAHTLADLRPGLPSAGHFAVSLLLCGISFGLGPTPAGISLLAVCSGSHVAACTLGMLLGYGMFWGLRASFPLYAAAAVVLCARALLPKKRQRTLVPAAFIGAYALIGLLSLVGDSISGEAVVRWVSGILVAAAGIHLFRAAQDRRNFRARIGAFCAVLLGLNSIRMAGGWNAAVAALAWTLSAPAGLTYACAGGAVLAAASPQMMPCAAAFCLGAIVHRLLKSKPPELSCAAVCLVYCLAGIRLGSYGFSACAMAGSICALLIRPGRVLPNPPGIRLPAHPARRELRQAAKAMTQAAGMLNIPDTEGNLEIAAIFDDASDQVCRSCAKFRTCWQEQGEQRTEDLTLSARSAMARGEMLREDLPERFARQCVHLDAFLTAVNDAMDDARARRQRASRLREARAAVQDQYNLMGQLMQRLSEHLYAPEVTVNYQPEISVQAAGRGGSALSGDRGAAFAGPDATYYVLLCDGMGTGPGAAGESLQAVGFLRRLLLSGMDAEGALKALNGLYILRDNGCFSTVDLLRINLTSGDAILYKWGAAPSYLKRGHGLRHLGGGNPPPVLSLDSAVEIIHLNLDRSCVLVLMSDGLGGKETKKRLESCDSLQPRDVAASLFAGRTDPPDDCTAVAIRLRRASVPEPVPT